MLKKIFITISLYFLSTLVYAQNDMTQQISLSDKENKTKIINYNKRTNFIIDKHITEMRARKQILEIDKDNLRNDIQTTKKNNHGKLLEEQKIEFKKRRNSIESKFLNLKEENHQFMEKLKKERENFFSSPKK